MSPPGDRGSTPRWEEGLATCLEVFVLTSALAVYWLGLHLTRPSPLTRTSSWQIVAVVAYAFLVAVCLASVLGVLAYVLDRATSRAARGTRPGSLLVKTVLAATLVLLFLDNLLYLVVGASLRNEVGSLAKPAFVVIAVALGAWVAMQLRRPRGRLVRWTAPVLGLASVVGLGVAATYLRQEEEPPGLGPGSRAQPLNVVILSADGINSDAMSVYTGSGRTTPFLDSIGEELLIFENAFSNNGNTTGSIVSLLTGRSPLETGVVYPPDALQQDDARRTLPYLLRRAGYRTSSWAVPHYVDSHSQNLVGAYAVENGHERSGLLSDLPLGSGAPRWFVEDLLSVPLDTWRDALAIEEMDNPYDYVISREGSVTGDLERLEGVMREVQKGGPFFINTHFMVTHGPYYRIPEGTSETPQTADWQQRHYRLAISVFDDYVSRVFTALEEEGVLDSTIVVITSDHGQQYDARQRVPLIVRFPDARPKGRVSVNVQRLDLAPTILSALGYSVPATMTGADLLRPRHVPPEREIRALTVPERVAFQSLGVRPQGDTLIETTVRCREYRQVFGDEAVDEGEVAGSTSPCT